MAADNNRDADNRLHRRTIFRHTLATSAGALALLPIIGCKGGDDDSAKKAEEAAKAKKEADEKNDVELFNKGILLEQGAINVYKAAAGLPFIAEDKDVLAVAGLFMSQHEEHRDSLAKWIKTLGGTAVDPKTAKTPDIPADITNDALEPAARKLAVLKFARSLEKAAADAYFQLIAQQLQTEFGRRSAAEILPVEAQHVAIYDFVLKAQAPVNAALFSKQS